MTTLSLEVEGLAKSFGAYTALQSVSFALPKGSSAALLGPSGCGKTTILRCLAGLEQPDAGRITVGGQSVFDAAAKRNLPPERRDIGVVFQSYAIWPHMTVAENVGFPLKLRRVDRATMKTRVDRMLDMVGLQSSGAKMATQLSGGQQQRVAIARALISEPQLILFDEALSNLDALLREQTRLELKLLQQRIGFTALYVTHDQTEAFALAEHVIVMNRGTIETSGDPIQVFDMPATPFVARFMGLNVIDGRIIQPGLIEIAGGVRLQGIEAPRQPDGANAIACIRKEHVVLMPHGQRPPAGWNSIGAEIVASAFLGINREYLVRIGDVEIKAISTQPDLLPGQPVWLSFESRHCIIFA
jgi:iron(III) transport system ATP-binding protein